MAELLLLCVAIPVFAERHEEQVHKTLQQECTQLFLLLFLYFFSSFLIDVVIHSSSPASLFFILFFDLYPPLFSSYFLRSSKTILLFHYFASFTSTISHSSAPPLTLPFIFHLFMPLHLISFFSSPYFVLTVSIPFSSVSFLCSSSSTLLPSFLLLLILLHLFSSAFSSFCPSSPPAFSRNRHPDVLRLGRTVIGDRVVVGHEELVIALSDR